MVTSAPHVIPYQGSKRKLANAILDQVQFSGVRTLYEPFAGSAAITLAAASRDLALNYVLGEKLTPLAELWEIIIEEPEKLIKGYNRYWLEQLESPKDYYFKVRAEYNRTHSPFALFYLIARCVKNAVRFNPDGEFNQSPDNRRLGMKPSKLQQQALLASHLLKGRTNVVYGDFRKTLREASNKDLVYLDPPWSGLTDNPRYAFLLDLDSLLNELSRLNANGVPFLLSFDGSCGDKSYKESLPSDLNLVRVSLNAGRSTQATLLGRNEVTVESLYLSPALREKNSSHSTVASGEEIPIQLSLLD
jgi:DNA adenine methylase